MGFCFNSLCGIGRRSIQKIGSFPSPAHERPLFRVLHVEVDAGSLDLRMAEEFLQESQRHTGDDTPHSERMAKPLRRGMHSADFSLRHHPLDDAPACCSGEWPQAALRGFSFKRQKPFGQPSRNRNAPEFVVLALLERTNADDPGRRVDVLPGDRQCFGDPDSGVVDGEAK